MAETIIKTIPLTPEEEAERAKITAYVAAQEQELLKSTRREAYQREADPLFFGWQRGDNTKQEWLDAVQAVKDANPYPEAPSN